MAPPRRRREPGPFADGPGSGGILDQATLVSADVPPSETGFGAAATVVAGAASAAFRGPRGRRLKPGTSV